MNIIINNQKRILSAKKLNIKNLLSELGVEQPEMVSVQRNGEFVDKDDYESILVQENDAIDFLYFMGGGIF